MFFEIARQFFLMIIFITSAKTWVANATLLLEFLGLCSLLTKAYQDHRVPFE